MHKTTKVQSTKETAKLQIHDWYKGLRQTIAPTNSTVEWSLELLVPRLFRRFGSWISQPISLGPSISWPRGLSPYNSWPIYSWQLGPLSPRYYKPQRISPRYSRSYGLDDLASWYHSLTISQVWLAAWYTLVYSSLYYSTAI